MLVDNTNFGVYMTEKVENAPIPRGVWMTVNVDEINTSLPNDIRVIGNSSAQEFETVDGRV